MVDGEVIILDDGMVVPADGYEPQMTGPGWNKEVTGYKIGQSASVRRAGVFYLGDRMMSDHRAVPWIGPALPFASALLTIRVAAGHGLAALAKIAAVVANSSARTGSPPGAGARSGVVASAGGVDNAAGRVAITSPPELGPFHILRPGEAVARIAAGPDEMARKYEHQLEMDAAAALNLPLHELLSDYSSGSFSNLRMAWQDAEREYKRRRVSGGIGNYRIPACGSRSSPMRSPTVICRG